MTTGIFHSVDRCAPGLRRHRSLTRTDATPTYHRVRGGHPAYRHGGRAPLPGRAAPAHGAAVPGAGPRWRPRRLRAAGIGPVRPPGRGGPQPRPGAPRPGRATTSRVDGHAAVRDPGAVRDLQQGPEPAAHRGAALVPGGLGHQHSEYRSGVLSRYETTVDAILERIRLEGPLSSLDFERKPAIDWWWGPTSEARALLEALSASGILGLSRREGNRRYFDLMERLMPPELLASRPREHDQRRHKLLSRYRAHGLLGAAGSGGAVAGHRQGPSRTAADPPDDHRPRRAAGRVRGRRRAHPGRGRRHAGPPLHPGHGARSCWTMPSALERRPRR